MGGSGAARGRLVAAACGSVLVALSFVPLWATYRIPGLGLFAPETRHLNAWAAYGLAMQAALVTTFAIVVLTISPAGRRAPGGRVVLALSVAATLSLLWEVVSGPEGSSRPGGYGISRGVLLFVGTGLACGMTYGGYVALRGTTPNGRSERADRGE